MKKNLMINSKIKIKRKQRRKGLLRSTGDAL
jgi:hypothetical protein